MKSIILENLSFGYNKNAPIFRDFSAEIRSENGEGYVCSIMGASGSGKSTLLKLIMGTEPNFLGRINMAPSNPIISYVPQEPVLFEHLSIMENARYFEKISRYSSQFDQKFFYQLIDILQLMDIIQGKKSVVELSGGQRQRLALVRALSIKPDFLFLDEPCTGLDAEVKRQFLIMLRELTEKNKLFVLYVTHHPEEARLIANEIIYLLNDSNMTSISHKVQGDIKSFAEQHPALEIAQVFNFPEINTFPCVIRGNQIVPLTVDDRADKRLHFLTFKSNIVHFSNESGFPIEFLAQTQLYILLRLKETRIVLGVHNQIDGKSIDYKFIILNGNAMLYNADFRLVGKVEINRNLLK